MFLLIDNYDSFTYNLVQAFYMLGEKPVVVPNDSPRLLELACDPALEKVCISPGPSSPEKAGLCLEFLRLLSPRVPVLGVCLGHQVLGLFGGASIRIAPSIVHGKQSPITHDGKGLFTGIASPMLVGRYHSLVVDMPEQENSAFAVTARGPEGEVMALHYKDRPWVGVQFHPESILSPEGLRLLGNFPQTVLPLENQVSMPLILETLAGGKALTATMAASGFARLMDGELSPAQAGAFLMGLRIKGESPQELAEAVHAALARSIRIPSTQGQAIDVVGTGGDGKHSFNCSTATALTLAGMGYTVIKHGNRAVSSTSGSADALERLGLPFAKTPQEVLQQAAEKHFAFVFAPYFHPAFKNIGGVRKEMGIRTLFNLLGPMINPACPSHLLMGVARPDMVTTMAQTLGLTRVQRAAVVCGAGGYDEISPLGAATVMLVDKGRLSPLELLPSRYGVQPCLQEDLAVHSKEEAFFVLQEILCGKGKQAMRDMVMLNVGLALYLLEPELTLDQCMEKASLAVQQGVGSKVVPHA
jgi:anthranilate synthase/phosphoribosyltransferase